MARILVVDDDTKTLDIIKRCLTANGHKVVTAASGEECLKIINEGIFNPHLILLDFQMEGMNGIEVLEILKEHESTWSIPVIMLSGITDDDIITEAMGNYATEYLTKPIGADDLAEKVAHVLTTINQG